MVGENIIRTKDAARLNAIDLLNEIDWFNRVVQYRMQLHTEKQTAVASLYDIEAPVHAEGSVFAEFVSFYQLDFNERIVLMLALLPHIYPAALDVFFSNKDLSATSVGGVKANQHSGFLPTAETALFLLAGNDLAKRFRFQQLFDSNHVFRQHNIVYLGSVSAQEPLLSAQLLVNDEYVDFFTGGRLRKPVFSVDFPAKQLHTPLEWEDLVLDEHTRQQLDEIRIWLKHGQTLLNEWQMNKHIKPGYKALFFGPPGTGKTLCTALLGKSFNLDVYRVDLSMVVSKYIGETEKNLEKVFAKAEHKNWILFFDEADALFGKRTSISDAHDKYANQEIAYLLQRLEDFNGLVILSSNMRDNVDEAFGRRLQSIIHFPLPQPTQRLKLWQQAFSTHTVLEEKADLAAIADKFELAGGSIINAVQYASLMALSREENIIREKDILDGIRKEFRKEGKTI